MFVYRYIRPTSKDHGHTKLFYKHKYIGYIMPNRSRFRAIGENWNFVSKSFGFECERAPNRDALIALIRIQCKDLCKPNKTK